MEYEYDEDGVRLIASYSRAELLKLISILQSRVDAINNRLSDITSRTARLNNDKTTLETKITTLQNILNDIDQHQAPP